MLIIPPYKDGDVVSIKLTNGEEIVTRLVSKEGNNVVVDRPVVLQIGPNGAPALMPYFMTVDPAATKNIALNSGVVVMMAATNKQLADQYTSALSGIQLAPPGLKL